MKKSPAGPLGEGLALGQRACLGKTWSIGVQLVLRVHGLLGIPLDAFLARVSGRVASASVEAALPRYRSPGSGISRTLATPSPARG